MKALEAFNYLKDYFKTTNQSECYLYYNIKKDCFESNFEKFKNRKDWQIFCGIWGILFDICKLEDYIEEIKYSFSLYDLSELTEKAFHNVCNGAGPKGYGWVVPDLWFTNAANFHDLMYTLGGNENDRLWADRCFLWRMQSATSGLKKAVGFLPCIYYRKVRKYGSGAFYKGEKRNIGQINKLYG